jgi:hypothetical protein
MGLFPSKDGKTFSDIPYKCSHFAEIENLKIFDFNHFSKS